MSYYDILLAKNLSGGGGGGDITVESLSVTANGTYSAPSGKAYSPVVANVPNSYTASDEGKVVSNGALVSQTSQTIDTNGTYDTTLKDEVVVDVPTGGGGSNIVKGNFNFDTSGNHDITIPYSGDGYILQLFIYPKDAARNYDIMDAHWRNCIKFLLAFKQKTSLTPNYSGSADENAVYCERLYGASNSTDTLSNAWAQTRNAYDDTDASSSMPCVKIRAKDKIAVWIADVAGNAGFLPNVDYEYLAFYSS